MNVLSLSQHHAQIAQVLRSFMPSNCRSLDPENVELIGNHPVAAGGFADIWKAIHDGRIVALKTYRRSMTSDIVQVVERFYNEIRVCSLPHHRDMNAVSFVGVYSTEAHPFALVYKYMDGLDLKQYSRNQPNARKLELLTDIARSLGHMANLGIIHGSLKATNVLVDKCGAPRIAGLSNVYIIPHSTAWEAESGVGINVPSRRRAELAGPGQSPNVIDSITPTRASDMCYAFGVMVFEILTGHPPFFELTAVVATHLMVQGRRPPRQNHPEISDRLWEMVERCWHIVPSQRMLVGEAVDILETELGRTS